MAIMHDSFTRMSNINIENMRIIGRCIAILDLLKDKGLYTDEEVKAKFKQLDDDRERIAKEKLETERRALIEKKEAESDKDSGNPSTSSLQS